MRFDYDSSRPAGERVIVDSVRIGNHRIVPDALYTATANAGLVMFLSLLGIPVQDSQTLAETASHAAQALIAARGTIDGGTSGRIRDVARGRLAQ